MLAISSVSLDGAAIPLANVAADITIRHGRSSYYDTPTPATAQVTLIGVSATFVRSITLSKPLVISYRVDGGPERPRFTGRTTDAAVDGDAVTIIGVGRLSTLDAYDVTFGWNEKTWNQRVLELWNFVGLQASLDLPAVGAAGNAFLLHDPAPSSRRSLAEYMDELLELGPAFMYDLPDGRVRVTQSSARTASAPLSIPPDKVLFSPAWTKVLPGANRANVGWGTADPQAMQSSVDTQAQAQYGERVETLSPTLLRDQAAAGALALAIVNREAWPRWSTPSVTLLEGFELAVDSAVKITDVPPPAPYSIWTAFVEGWTDTISSDGEAVTWTMEVALSDPNLSGVTVHTLWEDLPATDKWNTIDPTVTWANADALAP